MQIRRQIYGPITNVRMRSDRASKKAKMDQYNSSNLAKNARDGRFLLKRVYMLCKRRWGSLSDARGNFRRRMDNAGNGTDTPYTSGYSTRRPPKRHKDMRSGHVRLYINGGRVGSDLFVPPSCYHRNPEMHCTKKFGGPAPHSTPWVRHRPHARGFKLRRRRARPGWYATDWSISALATSGCATTYR